MLRTCWLEDNAEFAVGGARLHTMAWSIAEIAKKMNLCKSKVFYKTGFGLISQNDQCKYMLELIDNILGMKCKFPRYIGKTW